MQEFTKSIVFFALVFSNIFAVDASAQSTLSKQEIKATAQILMAVDDFEDADLIAKQKQLIELGPEAHLVLAELLEETSDPLGVSRILGLFVESKGDKRIAKAAVRKLLTRPRSLDPRKEITTFAVSALARIGDSQDAASIVHLIVDPDKNVRLAAIRALGEIGDQDSLRMLEAKKTDNAIQEDNRTQAAIEEARRKIQRRQKGAD